MYAPEFLEKIRNYDNNSRERVDKSEDCPFCGYKITAKTHKKASSTPKFYLDKYPLTCKTIFKFSRSGHKKMCTACQYHIEIAILQVDETYLAGKFGDTVRKALFPTFQESTNDVSTNGKSEKVNEFDQSKSKIQELMNLKRSIVELSSKESPRKCPKVTKSFYFVIDPVDGTGIKIFKEQSMIAKTTKDPGRGSLQPNGIDFMADMQVKAGVSANNDQTFYGQVQPKRKHLFCPKTALRSLTIKSQASDYIICQWMSNQKTIFAGFDGGGTNERKFFEYHLSGEDAAGNVSHVLLKLIELTEPMTGEKLADIL
jgi:hypothetical protein